MNSSAVLALANGTIFEGTAIGVDGLTTGEVVFNTSITGYQEILTDPSYAKQIVTLTHPHIGNTGSNAEDEESTNVWATGLVIRDLPLLASNWRSEQGLDDYLQAKNVVAIAEIDTRKLTRVLRDEGSQNGAIIAGPDLTQVDIEKALAAAKEFAGLKGMDLAKDVTTADPYNWQEGSWVIGEGYPTISDADFHVVAYDFGVKRNILRMLTDRRCKLTVVPAQTPASEVLAMSPDGVFLSNGPGDPDPCDYAITAIQEILKTNIPVFGICLGLQLLGLAAGMKTTKMGHGHHGANHPVQNLEDETVLITSQNHGFCIDESALPDNVRISHRSLFDNTIQGIHLNDAPAFGFQGHPEASPGPHDASPLFDHFIELMRLRNA
ncbi:MAG: glutamine-hydrolyzing carbamoyl-phosphate synthase small subunit [Pseudomonadales bacterium]|nr:glutamine-hydrolyzing carbamoyl-phosphate synthase small subunit [Pseudomonadales bacterium]MBO6566194.1 glutamine-hydrolyzing carbamoyl-phosphate synthase small subunit [Pseudomonadales bacterium]MBO6597451.1 glutamine-hydrolyzing carbamoyl-phosphate synthase small subunit [Pseudomonadales bacterium]MBO6824185.1 glutamine-hydrolyzing carbamoyl-phosphate synthase small subunit [Pseudomonadales bacterium]